MILTLSEDDRRAVLWRAAMISLFSWRRADPSDPNDGADPLGWWADSFPTVAGDKIGSRVWLLQRRSITDDALRDAVEFGEEALAWFVSDGHATKVTVTVARSGTEGVTMRAVIDLVGDDPLQIEIDDFWRVLNAI